MQVQVQVYNTSAKSFYNCSFVFYAILVVYISGIIVKRLPFFSNEDRTSCYANSTILALGMLTRMGQVMQQEVGALDGNQLHLSQQLQLVCWDKEHLSQPSCTTVAVREELSQIATNVDYTQPGQQDAHQFLDHLLNELPEAVQVLFRFQSQVHLSCMACGAEKEIAPEPMTVLMLHPEQEQSFDALLHKEQEESLDLNVNCDRCGTQRTHRRRTQYSLGDGQHYLLVYMSTFGADQRRIGGRQIRKFNSNRSSIFGGRFRTVAAIEHRGETSESGHYTCWVRSGNGWTNVDDLKTIRRENKRFVNNLKDICLLVMEKV